MDAPLYRYIAAVEFAGGFALAGAEEWRPRGDLAIMTGLA